MSGPEHYLKAEQIVADVNTVISGGQALSTDQVSALLAEAQVHATLAHTAAAVLAITPDGGQWREIGAWYRVTGVRED